MRIMLVTLTLIATTILGGCNSEPTVEPADLVFAGGAVFTSDPDQPNASAVAVRGERIVYVGDEAGIEVIYRPRYPKNRYWRWTPHIGTYGFTHPRL